MAFEDLLSTGPGASISDLVNGLFGNDRFSNLFDQSESDFLQYSDDPTDRTLWSGTKSKDTPDYFFLLKYQGTTVQIPFNVSPQRETVSEPHAMTVTVMQGGGKVVNSEGMVLKNITIQGLTGLYPGAKGQTPLPGSGIGSGLEQIKFLETLLRRYCYLKRYGDLSSGLQLIYVSRRSQDAWAVEPKQFDRDDDVAHNFQWGYTIALETMYPYSGEDTKSLVEQLLDMLPGYGLLSTIVDTLNQTVDILNSLAGQIESVATGFITTVLGPLVSLANSFSALKNGTLPNLANFKKSLAQQIVADLQSIAAALETSGAPTKVVNAVTKAEKATLATLNLVDVYTTPPNQAAQTITSKQVTDAAKYTAPDGSKVSPKDALSLGANPATTATQAAAAAAAANPGSNPIANPSNPSATVTYASNPTSSASAQSSVGTSTSSASSTQSVNAPVTTPIDPATLVPPGVQTAVAQFGWNASWKKVLANIDPSKVDYKTATVNAGDDIQTVAKRLLGDTGRWPELVMLNGLRAPYLASAAYITANPQLQGSVITYGSPITFPVKKASNSSAPTQENYINETDVSLTLTPFQRSLGNDIYVDAVLCDVQYTSNDFQLVYAEDFISQYIRQRFVTRQGTFRMSQRLGFSKYLGLSQGVTDTVVKAEGRGLFFGSSIVTGCNILSTQINAGRLFVTAAVFIRDKQDPIITTQAV